MSRKLTCVLFDLDDTLHSKSDALQRCALDYYNRFLIGEGVCQSAFVQHFIAEHNVIQPKSRAFSRVGRLCNIDTELLHTMAAHFDGNFHHYCECFSGVMKLLDRLDELNIGAAIVSNGRDFFQRQKIDAMMLTERMRLIVTSQEVEVKKPDVRIFQYALAQLGVDAGNVAFCGDNIYADIEPAKALGMWAIHKLSPGVQPAPIADFHFTDFSQWDAILAELAVPRIKL